MKVALASDHAGLDLKNHLLQRVTDLGHTATDLGAYTHAPSDYPDFAEAIGRAVVSGTVDRGILICGSGVGASVAANKIKGIRAAICHDSYSANQGVEHDDMNVLVLGSRVIGTALADDLIKNFLAATFTHEERHVRRLAKVKQLEELR